LDVHLSSWLLMNPRFKKKDYVMSQVGNPEGEDKPNKKYYDPRVWVREGEKTMSARVAEALVDFNTADKV
jgi:fructose-bisphosphate aldolase, class II